MRWFEKTRQDWIIEMVGIFGFINRHHVMKKFGVTEAVASKDFATIQAATPSLMTYNKSVKRYELNTGCDISSSSKASRSTRRSS